MGGIIALAHRQGRRQAHSTRGRARACRSVLLKKPEMLEARRAGQERQREVLPRFGAQPSGPTAQYRRARERAAFASVALGEPKPHKPHTHAHMWPQRPSATPRAVSPAGADIFCGLVASGLSGWRNPRVWGGGPEGPIDTYHHAARFASLAASRVSGGVGIDGDRGKGF